MKKSWSHEEKHGHPVWSVVGSAFGNGAFGRGGGSVGWPVTRQMGREVSECGACYIIPAGEVKMTGAYLSWMKAHRDDPSTPQMSYDECLAYMRKNTGRHVTVRGKKSENDEQGDAVNLALILSGNGDVDEHGGE